jgi:uncharacterized protein with NRDE domain
LVVASNRDEFLDRPTAPLARWTTPAGHTIIGGRDLRAGGAWFGITQAGRIAFLTNVREPGAAAGARSRGELVTAWLESSDDATRFLAGLPGGAADFGGFNLVVGDFARRGWAWVTNRGEAARSKPGWHLQQLPPGLYGLSNAAMDTPWPKTLALKSALAAALPAPTPDLLEAALWPALGSSERASSPALPATGVPLEVEEALSSAFVDFPANGYGTRSSTVLTVTLSQAAGAGRATGAEVRMTEREHVRGAVGKPWRVRRESLRWPAPQASASLGDTVRAA